MFNLGHGSFKKSSCFLCFSSLRCLLVFGFAVLFVGRGRWETYQTKASFHDAATSGAADIAVSSLVGVNQKEVEKKIVATVRSLEKNIFIKTTKLPTFRPSTRLKTGTPLMGKKSTRPPTRLGIQKPSASSSMPFPTITTIKTPSRFPTQKPTAMPSSKFPTRKPSIRLPSRYPTRKPNTGPPSRFPTKKPSTSLPSRYPTQKPTTSPPSRFPTQKPTTSPPYRYPTKKPITSPPSRFPTRKPSTRSPSRVPTVKPSTSSPSRIPTVKPSTSSPSQIPTQKPSTISPSRIPTQNPSTASPVKTAVMVGAYYYPWYFGGAFHGGKVLRFFLDPQQPPLLGKYNMTDPAVILQHLMWSRKANIGLWATSWWGPRSREDTTTINVILNHSDIGQHKIALLYETNNRLRISGTNYSTAWIETDINHMCENYFSHPNYYQIDGRPVVFIYLTRSLSGMKILDSVLILMKAAAAKYNFDPYFIGDQVWSNAPSGTYAPFTQLDAVTSYDVRGGLRMNDTTNYVTQTRLNNYYSQQQGWKTAANSQGCAYVPPTLPGFNDRGVRLGSGHGAVSRRLSPDADPGSLFRASLKAAVALVDSRTNNLMMINSFNEWHEDTQIEPTNITNTTILPLNLTQGVEYEGYGEFYLDIVAAET